jgi:hypothetical protein
MNGVKRWHLYDPDTLDDVNLVKHPRLRAELGKLKVDCQQNWILDRNSESEVHGHQEDVIKSSSFRDSVSQSSLVLCCVDKNPVREFINDVCVSLRVPCVTASVFRTGVGGEVYGYIPNETGCYRCLQLYAEKSGLNMPDSFIEMTSEEEEHIYGLGEKEFQASGLSIDIQFISLIQARMALSVLLRGVSKFPLLKSNWIIFGNRPKQGLFRSHFQCDQKLLRPQNDCICTVER